MGGHIEYLDLDNVFQNNNEDLQSIIDEKIFDESLVVEGNATFEGPLNGFNISELCGFMSDSVNPRDLIIQGNLFELVVNILMKITSRKVLHHCSISFS